MKVKDTIKRLNKKCYIKDCKEKSIAILNTKFYCRKHYREQKKINKSLLNMGKKPKKKRKYWVCKKCKERIPFSNGKRKLYCDNCKNPKI